MSHELICEWLGLPAGTWPPDHYRLLGLEPGESDAERIERCVHERLDAVRHYQMMHPEQATEAMNRLAQAYVCLTEPGSKRAYDAQLFGTAAPAGAPVALAEAPEPASATPDPLAWLFGPAVLPRDPLTTPAPASRLSPPQPLQPKPAPAAPEPVEPVDPVIAAAQQSPRARRGLGTKRALYGRVVSTRKLLRLWEQLGQYMESAKRRLSRSADGPELVRLLGEMQSHLRHFPRLMGAAGQPGYLVVMLTQQDDLVRSFQGLNSGQREALSRDWSAGRKLLAAHIDYLRQEIRVLRKLTAKQRLLRAVRAVVADQPATFFLLVLLVALNIAVWRAFGPQILQLFEWR
jgi:hypothetical protein